MIVCLLYGNLQISLMLNESKLWCMSHGFCNWGQTRETCLRDQIRLEPACSVTDLLESWIVACSKLRYHSFQRWNNESADQTACKRRLIWACVNVVHMQQNQVFLRRGPFHAFKSDIMLPTCYFYRCNDFHTCNYLFFSDLISRWLSSFMVWSTPIMTNPE